MLVLMVCINNPINYVNELFDKLELPLLQLRILTRLTGKLINIKYSAEGIKWRRGDNISKLSNMSNGFKFKKLQGTDFQSLKPHEGPVSSLGNKDQDSIQDKQQTY